MYSREEHGYLLKKYDKKTLEQSKQFQLPIEYVGHHRSYKQGIRLLPTVKRESPSYLS